MQYSPRHSNHTKALSNWQRKSEHLLHETIKFQIYIEALIAAQKAKAEVYARRAEGKAQQGGGAKGPTAQAAAARHPELADFSVDELTLEALGLLDTSRDSTPRTSLISGP